MTKLAISPNASGYTVKRSNDEVLSVSLAGGASRQRLDKLGAPAVISVKFTVDENGYLYLNAFFNSIAAKGSLPFQCDLIYDKPYLTTHNCRYVKGSFGLESNNAYTFNCSAQLEVLPIAADSDFDAQFVAFYEVCGPNLDVMLNLLDKLANVAMPGMNP